MPSSTSTFGSPATFGLGFGQKRGVRRAKTRAGKGNAPNEEVDLEDLYLDSKGNLNSIFAFQIIDHKQYNYRQYSSVAADETGRYIKFFRACYNNDIETVKALATPSRPTDLVSLSPVWIPSRERPSLLLFRCTTPSCC